MNFWEAQYPRTLNYLHTKSTIHTRMQNIKITVDSYLRNILLRDDLSKQKGTANNCNTILSINNLIVIGFIIAHRQDRDITE